MWPWHGSGGWRASLAVGMSGSPRKIFGNLTFSSHMCERCDVIPSWCFTICHTILCLILCVPFSGCFYMSDSLFTRLFGFTRLWFCKLVHSMFSCLAVRLSAWVGVVCASLACCFWGCCKFVQGFGVACLCYLSLCVLLRFQNVCLCFCLDYYGMQLAAEPLPVYCPHPGPGIITDITRLFTVWEPRWAIFIRSVKPSLNLWPYKRQLWYILY